MISGQDLSPDFAYVLLFYVKINSMFSCMYAMTRLLYHVLHGLVYSFRTLIPEPAMHMYFSHFS